MNEKTKESNNEKRVDMSALTMIYAYVIHAADMEKYKDTVIQVAVDEAKVMPEGADDCLGEIVSDIYFAWENAGRPSIPSIIFDELDKAVEKVEEEIRELNSCEILQN